MAGSATPDRHDPRYSRHHGDSGAQYSNEPVWYPRHSEPINVTWSSDVSGQRYRPHQHRHSYTSTTTTSTTSVHHGSQGNYLPLSPTPGSGSHERLLVISTPGLVSKQTSSSGADIDYHDHDLHEHGIYAQRLELDQDRFHHTRAASYGSSVGVRQQPPHQWHHGEIWNKLPDVHQEDHDDNESEAASSAQRRLSSVSMQNSIGTRRQQQIHLQQPASLLSEPQPPQRQLEGPQQAGSPAVVQQPASLVHEQQPPQRQLGGPQQIQSPAVVQQRRSGGSISLPGLIREPHDIHHEEMHGTERHHLSRYETGGSVRAPPAVPNVQLSLSHDHQQPPRDMYRRSYRTTQHEVSQVAAAPRPLDWTTDPITAMASRGNTAARSLSE